ncbi:MAG: nucleotide exchange factor GrpE [Dehalococcoidia bacterium]
MSARMDDNLIMPEEGDEGTESPYMANGQGEVIGKGESEDVEALKKAFAEEEAKAEKYLSNWQRSQADFANYKRRTEQEREAIIKLANAGLILNLLSVVDDMERALDHVSGKTAGAKWVDGIVLIYRKFMAILEANGVSEIKALEAQFDPNLHEAAAHVEGEDGKVVAVIQKGYMLNDRVLRPARVTVGNGRSAAADDDIAKDE